MKRVFQLLLIVGLCATASAFEFNRQPAGLIKGARLSYVSSSAIKVGVGYGEIMGSYWEITATDVLNTTGYTLTGLAPTANGVFHYIYIDRANSSLPNVTLTNSTTAPAWSDDFMGWYNGSDRCIGVVRVGAAGAIKQFFCPDDESYVWGSAVSLATVASVSTVWNVWTAFDLTNFSPVNTRELRLSMAAWDNANPFAWKFVRVGCKAGSSVELYGDGVFQAASDGWHSFVRGMARQCSYLTWATNSNGQAVLSLFGYKIER